MPPICHRQAPRSIGFCQSLPAPLCIEVYSSVINTGEADHKYAHAWYNVGWAMLQNSIHGYSNKSIAEASQKMRQHFKYDMVLRSGSCEYGRALF